MEYTSTKYSKKPAPRISADIRSAFPPEFLKTYAVVRFSSPMAALLTPSHQPPPNGGRLDGVVGGPNE
jgi:hypothetical protein